MNYSKASDSTEVDSSLSKYDCLTKEEKIAITEAIRKYHIADSALSSCWDLIAIKDSIITTKDSIETKKDEQIDHLTGELKEEEQSSQNSKVLNKVLGAVVGVLTLIIVFRE